METNARGRGIDTAEGLTQAIIALVGADGFVDVESPVAEFERVVHLTPRAATAVVLDVMIGYDDDDAMPGNQGHVVVWARRPSVGWWTFDDLEHGDGHLAAWAVVAQLVEHGGTVDPKHPDGLIDGHGATLLGAREDARPRPGRHFTFPGYRGVPEES